MVGVEPFGFSSRACFASVNPGLQAASGTCWAFGPIVESCFWEQGHPGQVCRSQEPGGSSLGCLATPGPTCVVSTRKRHLSGVGGGWECGTCPDKFSLVPGTAWGVGHACAHLQGSRKTELGLCQLLIPTRTLVLVVIKTLTADP